MIVYAVISRSTDGIVLVESSTKGLGGNAPQVTGMLLESLKANADLVSDGKRKTFVQRNDVERSSSGVGGTGAADDWNPFTAFADWACGLDMAVNSSSASKELNLDHFFHVYCFDKVFYICLSDDVEPRLQAVNFAFLNQIQEEFTRQYASHRIKKANAYSMDKSFSRQLGSIMHRYNTNQSTMARGDKINSLHAEVDDLKTVMGRNINVMLTRGENLDELVEKSEMLRGETVVFKKRSTELKRILWTRNYKYMSILALFVLALIYFMAAAVCGPFFQRCGFKNGDG